MHKERKELKRAIILIIFMNQINVNPALALNEEHFSALASNKEFRYIGRILRYCYKVLVPPFRIEESSQARKQLRAKGKQICLLLLRSILKYLHSHTC
jgi:hypothetical protein